MGAVEQYQRIIRELLGDYVKIPYLNQDLAKEVLFDDVHARYKVVTVGWQKGKRVHNCVIHLDVIGDKVWVQKDNTDIAIARELERAGIPKTAIVLGFHDPATRQRTDYAVA